MDTNNESIIAGTYQKIDNFGPTQYQTVKIYFKKNTLVIKGYDMNGCLLYKSKIDDYLNSANVLVRENQITSCGTGKGPKFGIEGPYNCSFTFIRVKNTIEYSNMFVWESGEVSRAAYALIQT